MALCAFSMNPSVESVELWHFSCNLSTRLIRPSCLQFNHKSPCHSRRQLQEVRCSFLRKAASQIESKGNAPTSTPVSGEEEQGHVTRFKMSDFKVLDHVSVGLAGRADEVVFEAIVMDSNSPLYDSKVVLRQLTSSRAQRRGRRAMEVLKKLARRRILYHSYSMQVYGYISSHTSGGHSSFTLVHGYHGSFSLRHWLQQSDWLPTLEATLALDEESVRRVGDDSVGGPAGSRQLRLIRILMRDLLIGVNYLHSHGIAHTELRLENVHISPIDRHIKVGILGNAADFYEDGPNGSALEGSMDRRQMMIAFDMRCVGFMMAKMVLRELMDPLIFSKFKSFFMKLVDFGATTRAAKLQWIRFEGNDPSCLREFLVPILTRNSPNGNIGLQILDRNWGAGWSLLSLLLAVRPSKRISCLDALRHPFLCGPRWRVVPSMDIIRWGLGSTAVRITEEYIYGQPQRGRIAHFIELMEMLNPHSRPKNWLEFLPGKWRLLYSTGRHLGLTLRQPSHRVLIGDAFLTIVKASKSNTNLSIMSEIGFTVMTGHNWPHEKKGISGKLQVNCLSSLKAGRRLYLKEKPIEGFSLRQSNSEDFLHRKLSTSKWRKAIPFKEFPSSLPVAKLLPGDIEVSMSLDANVDVARNVIQEIRIQIPPEMFELSNLVCGTYVDSRMLVLRGVNGSALLFTRSCAEEDCNL